MRKDQICQFGNLGSCRHRSDMISIPITWSVFLWSEQRFLFTARISDHIKIYIYHGMKNKFTYIRNVYLVTSTTDQ